MKTVLVTGASSGMGKEIARKLLGEEYTVYVAARRLERMKALEDLGAIALPMDITREEDLVAAVRQIERSHAGVDVLINNAGFGSYGAMEDTLPGDARYQFDVNLFGPARLTQLVLPRMREKRAGKIVNVSSMGGKIYTPLGSWYHATKHALEGWSDCLRLELAQFGIDVIIIEPGIVRTSFGEVMLGPMMERSGNTAYGALAKRIERATRESYERGGGSPPSVIATVVAKAIRARKPKTRYAVGKLAKPLILMRKWLGDRLFDRIIMRAT